MNRLTRRTALTVPLLALPLAQSVPASASIDVRGRSFTDLHGQKLTPRAFEAWTRAVAERQISGTITGMFLLLNYDTAAIFDALVPMHVEHTISLDSIRVRSGVVRVYCDNMLVDSLMAIVRDPIERKVEYVLHNFDTDLSHYELGKWDE